jgi:hypothetical protein
MATDLEGITIGSRTPSTPYLAGIVGQNHLVGQAVESVSKVADLE